MTAENDKSKLTPAANNKPTSLTGEPTHTQDSIAPGKESVLDGQISNIPKKTTTNETLVATKAIETDVHSSSLTENSATSTERVEATDQSRVAGDVSKMDTVSTSNAKKDMKNSTSASDAGRQASNRETENKSSKKPSSGSKALNWFAGLAIVLVVLLALALWWQNQRFDAVSREVANRLQVADQQVSKLSQDVQSALSQNASQTEQLALLQRDVRTMRSEVNSIDQAWQSVSRSLDDRLLVSYLRRLLSLTQQLILTGHVSGAISVLESAVEMIQSHHSPEQFVALASAIGTDLERLRAMPVVDVSALSKQLGQVVGLVEKAPLLVPDFVVPQPISTRSGALSKATETETAATAESIAADKNVPWWQTWLNTAGEATTSVARVISREFSDLMQVRRADITQTLLLSEEQAMLVRTNLRSMLLTAQLALLNRQATIWSAELEAVEAMLKTYYDVESTEVQAALNLLKTLRESPVAVDVKPITESLSALAVVAQTVTVPATSGENR